MTEKEEEKTHPAQFRIPDNSLHVKFCLSITIRVLRLTISDIVLIELIWHYEVTANLKGLFTYYVIQRGLHKPPFFALLYTLPI